ncbi:GIY-YIG nuclease family protein [bacterium]|nr:GIY-YIG nuclease family protein [bacterium]
MNNYYVYQLIDPRNNEPFYIGEGKENRAWSHLIFKSGCNNPHKDRVIRKIQSLGLQVIVEIVQKDLSKVESIRLEEALISKIGIDKLTNICPNANPPLLFGEKNGFYGKTHTEENKKKCGDSNRGRNTKTEAGSNSISNAMKIRWEDPILRENQINALKSRKGEKRSPEALESYKKSAALRDSKMTPEERSARTLAGVATKKIKYAGLKKQAYIDDSGKKRFRYVPAID